MAHKRASESCEDIVNSKVSKLTNEFGSDITLENVTLSVDLKSSLEYDSVLKTFSITLEKERKDGDRFVCFGEEEMQNILKLLPTIENLATRYSSKRAPNIIDIPFEASSCVIGNLVTVVSLKENSYKRGQFDIDIRKCVKKDDAYQYTSEGVRISQSLVGRLRETLFSFKSLIARATEKTRYVISVATAYSIIRHIEDMSDPRHHCHGCLIEHPSQKEHMGNGGCMSLKQPAWTDLSSQHWQAAKHMITESDIQTMARGAVSHMPELQNIYIPGLISTNSIPDHDLKDLVARKNEMEDDPLFRILSDI